MTWNSCSEHLRGSLELAWPPVAISFRPEAPPDIPRIESSALASCSYWKLAQEGKSFYTEASDHYGCPIGAHTHGVELPPEKAPELQGIVAMMVQLQYVREEEIPRIPTRTSPFRTAVYAPLDKTPVDPEVVLVRGTARQIMLLSEAAGLAGVESAPGLMGRPTCAMLPVAAQNGQTAGSLGCIGNRVYTGLADDEFYFAIPGSELEAVVDKLQTILSANAELEKFHRSRQE